MQQEHDRRRVKTPQRSKNFESQKQDKSGEDGERHFKRRRLSSQDHNPPPETDGCDEFDELVKGRYGHLRLRIDSRGLIAQQLGLKPWLPESKTKV